MNPSDPEGNIIRFGAFELDRKSGELRKHGIRIRLQEQPLRILLILLERTGDVVTRERLREQLWPLGTYVDFDHSLNAAIAKLRARWGTRPARRGFLRRSLGEVTVLSHQQQAWTREPPNPESVQCLLLPRLRCRASRRLQTCPPSRRTLLVLAPAIGWVMVAGRWLLVGRREPPIAVTATPLTSLRGSETMPAFSPDGKAVAFMWDNGESSQWRIWVKALGWEIPPSV